MINIVTKKAIDSSYRHIKLKNMKRILPLIIIYLTIASTLSAQQIKISGKVVDKTNAQPIEYANVTLLQSDSTFVKGVNSDANGLFNIVNPTGNYLVSISYMGYETSYVPVENPATDSNLGNITLEPSSVALNTVTVTAQSVIDKADRKLIFPSESQIKTSTNGLDLLQQLQLPRININPIDNAITTSGRGEVQLRINGALTTNEEIRAITPSDIIRIEYHDDPGARYGSASAVLDYIVRRRESGGNIHGDLMNIIGSTGFAEDNLSVKVNHRKSEFGMNAYWGYRKLEWTRTNSETFNFPDRTLHRNEIGEPTLFKYNNLNLALNYSLMEADKYFLNVTFRNSYNNSPNLYTNRNSSITTSDNSVPLSISDLSSEKTNIPSLDVYYQRNLKKDQLIIVNVVGTYINSKNNRIYEEWRDEKPITDIQSHISGDKYSLITEGIYEKKTEKGKFTTGLKHAQVFTRNEYTGNTIAEVAMNLAETYVYAEYQFQKGKFNYVASLGGIRSYYSQGEDVEERYSFRPSARVTYNISDKTFVRYKVNIWGNTPSLGDLNAVEQIIDSLQIRRGNPNLRMSQGYSNNITAGYDKGMFGVDLFLQYNYQRNPVAETILFEEGKFIRTYENQKAHHQLGGELTLRFRPIKDRLTIAFTPGINRYISEGSNYTHTYTNKYMRLSIDGNYKNWVANFMIYTPWDYFYGETLESGERIHSISFGYNKPNYSIILGSFNPFGGTYKRNDQNWSAMIPTQSKVYTENLTQLIYIKASFNVNFGRQFKGGDKRLNNSDNDSGIMSSSK